MILATSSVQITMTGASTLGKTWQRYLVEDACALVEVAYEPLPAVVDPERAQDPGLPLVDETIPANRAYTGVFASGDVAAALGVADRYAPPGPPDARSARAARLPGELAARR